jgi:short-subunit dehydrogenase
LASYPAPFAALYSSTKHALEGYTESLDHEVRNFGIRVCLLEPAYTRTSFEQNMALPDRTLDAYVSARAGANALMHDAMKTADDPEVVAENLIEAAAAASIHLREGYPAGERASSFCARADVRQESSQADAVAGLVRLVRPTLTEPSPLTQQ